MIDVNALYEDGGVAAFQYQKIINDIVMKIYVSSLDKPKYIEFHSSIPNVIDDMHIIAVNNKLSGSKCDQIKVNDNCIESVRIIINFNYLNKFDSISLFRIIYHELNHLIESNYNKSFLYNNPIKYQLVNDLKDRAAYALTIENSIYNKFDFQYLQILYSTCVPTESKSLVGGLYGELLAIYNYGLVKDLNEAVKNTQAYICRMQLREILNRLKEIPDNVINGIDDISEELPKEPKTKTYTYAYQLSDADFLDILVLSKDVFFKAEDMVYDDEFLRYLLKLFPKIEKYMQDHIAHCLGLFLDTEKRAEIATDKFIKDKMKLSQDDIDNYRKMFDIDNQLITNKLED